MADRNQWKRRVAEWRASGLSASEFAAGRGFARSTLTWWAWRLGSVASVPEGRPAAAGAGLVRVLVRDEEAVAPETPVVVEVGGVRVRVARGFDRGVLRDVVSLLSERGRGDA